MNSIYESVTILILFPLIVSMGAGSNVSGRSVTSCKFFGEISYPLHHPLSTFIYMQMSWARSHPNASTGTAVFVGVSIFIAAIAIAYGCL